MGIKNGGRFIREQIDSILPQIGVNDELVVSDDGSTDNSGRLIESYGDSRIRLLPNPKRGLISNFENCLNASRGDLIFLSDQDDVWHPEKVQFMTETLRSCDLAVCDCQVVDKDLKTIYRSFFEFNRSRPGLLKNLIKSSFMGCCMAFHRRVLEKALPFPDKILVHDQWIGLIAERYFSVKFVPKIMVDHRRHHENHSTTGGPSLNSIEKKLKTRFHLAKKLFLSQ
jgi:glycosyltransferase involved in cell wall biosynthesis